MVDSTEYLSDTIQSQINQCIPGLDVEVQSWDSCFNIIHASDYAIHMEFAAGRFNDEESCRGRPLLGMSSGINREEESRGFPPTLSWTPLPSVALYLIPGDVKKASLLPVFRLFKATVSIMSAEEIAEHVSGDHNFPDKWFPDWEDYKDVVYYVDTCIRIWMTFNSISRVDIPGREREFITSGALQIYGNPPKIQEDESCSE